MLRGYNKTDLMHGTPETNQINDEEVKQYYELLSRTDPWRVRYSLGVFEQHSCTRRVWQKWAEFSLDMYSTVVVHSKTFSPWQREQSCCNTLREKHLLSRRLSIPHEKKISFIRDLLLGLRPRLIGQWVKSELTPARRLIGVATGLFHLI